MTTTFFSSDFTILIGEYRKRGALKEDSYGFDNANGSVSLSGFAILSSSQFGVSAAGGNQAMISAEMRGFLRFLSVDVAARSGCTRSLWVSVIGPDTDWG